MEPHQQRVLDEKAALDEKIGKLDTFLLSGTFSSLEPGDKLLLESQLSAMRDYSDILHKRIERF